MKESEKFEQWFDGQFICSRQSFSPILISENKTQKAKFGRIKEICEMIIENPKESQQTLREQIAMKYFITMRCSLDYLHYAQLIIKEYEKSK
jgi:hypothetical protein